tara:strand:+ start:378 stop:545 length:168 start_codon:yes stop_codon:yes gene_type:complete
MKSFSFFEIDSIYGPEIIKKINKTKWRGTTLKIELAKDFSKQKSMPKKKRKKTKF